MLIDTYFAVVTQLFLAATEWGDMGTEDQRPMAFHSDLKEELMVRHFVGYEKLGECFEYVVTLYSENEQLQLDGLLGTHATVEVRMDLPEKAPRYFDGIVCEFGHVGVEETFHVYRVTLRPWLWLLSRSRGCEIFQNLTPLAIARDMFGKGESGRRTSQKRAETRAAFAEFHDGDLLLPGPKREFTVQYRESDLDFVCRILEQTGIYFFFKHEKGKHTLVLADSIMPHDSYPGCSPIHYQKLEDAKNKPYVGQFYEWTSNKQIATGAVEQRDFDFMKPRATLETETSKPRPGDRLAKGLIYDFPGCYDKTDPGTRCSLMKLEEAQVAHHLVRGVSDSRGLSAGARFMLQSHTRDSENREYLVISNRFEFDAGSFHSGGAVGTQCINHITAIPSEVPFRPARRAPIPFIPGPQTARVVGPKEGEFWTDAWGRVKVQFAWDRDGKYDTESSCMVRVSQAWAGAGWGAFHLPRIGQEVLVEFLDGDLDRPIVTGRVYNDPNKVPYDPQKNPQQSGFKTRTVGGNENQYNELRFDDKKDGEEVFVRAQKDYKAQILHNRTTNIGNDHKHTVKKNLAVTVSEGEYTTEVEKDRMYIHVPKSEFHVVSQSITEDADTNIVLMVHGSMVKIDATSIELTVPGSMIRLGPEGVTVNGTVVKINS